MFVVTSRVAIFDGHILTLDETGFSKAALESSYKRCGFAQGRVVDQEDSRDGLLRARPERPRCRRATEQRDELASPHVLLLSEDRTLHVADIAASFNYVVGNSHYARRNGDPKCLSGLEVDHKLVLSRLHNRQISSLFTFENSPDVDTYLAICVRYPVAVS